MKNIETKDWKKKNRCNSWKTYAAIWATAICMVINWCDRPTDIVKREASIERTENQLRHLVDERKTLVDQYNHYLELAGSPGYTSTKFKEAQYQEYEAILKKEKKIDRLIYKHNFQKKRLSKKQFNLLKNKPDPKQKMDRNKYDYLWL